MAFLNEQGVERLWGHIQRTIDDKIEQNSEKSNSPLTTGKFFYKSFNDITGSSVDEKAQWLSQFEVVVYQGALSNTRDHLALSIISEIAIWQKALEINPDLKVFGYVTSRGYGYNTTGGGTQGMTEYRTSPSGIDHPILTKEEIYAYMDIMGHVGGEDTSETNEWGNPVRTGGSPFYGVFFDDYDYNYNDQNTHLMNQGDWSSVREKHNDLINYAHSIGLKVMANSRPNYALDMTATSNFFNPNGLRAAFTEEDWLCLESYFLRAYGTYTANNHFMEMYRNDYKEEYNCKILGLSYTAEATTNEQDLKVAATFAIYQALCEGVNCIALQNDMIISIPREFENYYDATGSATYLINKDTLTLTLKVNGHTIQAIRSPSKTVYGEPVNAETLGTCKIIVDGMYVFNDMFTRPESQNEEIIELKKDVDALKNGNSETSSNLYHRAFIDDWIPTYGLRDYTNYMPAFSTSFGGEDTGTTATEDPNDIHSGQITLPARYSWRRFEFNAVELAGKKVEIGFDSAWIEAAGIAIVSPEMTWQIIALNASNGETNLGTFTVGAAGEEDTEVSAIDNENRPCTVVTIPEGTTKIRFWAQRTATGNSWLMRCNYMYLVDLGEYTVTKNWYTNYLPSYNAWKPLTSYGNTNIVVDDNGDGVTINFLSATSSCDETGWEIPADSSMLQPGETWEFGAKEIYAYDDDGNDVTSKIQVYFGGDKFPGAFNYYTKNYNFYNGTVSELGEPYKVLSRVTIPETWTSGMPSNVKFLTKFMNFAGGQVRADGSHNLYHIHIRGLYYYKLDEAEELQIRGKDPSNTYIRLNRVNEKIQDENYETDSLYIVDDGSMFITNTKGERVDLAQVFNSIILRSQTPGSTKQFKFYVTDDRVLQLEEI